MQTSSFHMVGTVFTCVDWFCELGWIFFASSNASCLQDNSNTQRNLSSCHQCNKLCSKAWLRELWMMSCGFWCYLQLAKLAEIGEETTNLRSLTTKVAHICTHSGSPVKSDLLFLMAKLCMESGRDDATNLTQVLSLFVQLEG
jgi:hypothetical protein